MLVNRQPCGKPHGGFQQIYADEIMAFFPFEWHLLPFSYRFLAVLILLFTSGCHGSRDMKKRSLPGMGMYNLCFSAGICNWASERICHFNDFPSSLPALKSCHFGVTSKGFVKITIFWQLVVPVLAISSTYCRFSEYFDNSRYENFVKMTTFVLKLWDEYTVNRKE